MTRTRIAIVGLGMAVEPHARALTDLSDRVEVAWAVARDPARRAAFAARHPFPLAESLEAVLADPTVQAVAVLTPANTHAELALACARAGKHVLLEKPLEVTTARAEALVAGCRAAGVRLGVVLQQRFKPAGERAAAILTSGALGQLVGASASVRLWRAQSYYDEPGRGTYARDGGGVMMAQAIHTLDMLLSLTGPVAQVTGFAGTTPIHRMEAEDMVAAAVRFANGALGTIEATTAAFPGHPEEIRLTGSKGTLAITGEALHAAFHDGRTEVLEPVRNAGGWGADPMAFPHDNHRALIAEFLDAIEQGRAPRISGEEALRVHRLIDALAETGRRGGSPVVPG